ncbi:PIR Superfamily Protein [Plasmodium ovale wallikeri]|uniref:PIR Superfamily Protein n=1 Tax=Plasmodium ovale wallikeri TaxID=864142 RepID=A0A1A9AA64_PLAOA|nr:PIR Superfamily Protein [Plasmodium ovale wallikeri]SBT59296.1 PIR Superfamily Protein [Plasmodium ovale wallikeri]
MCTLFEKFPLEKLYNEFNADIDTDKKYNHCHSMNSEKWRYPGIEVFCKKLVRNLENISRDKLQYKLLNNPCPYLYYWFNNEVLKMISSSVGGNYTILINRLRNPWQDINASLGNYNGLCNYPTRNKFLYNENIIKFNELRNYLFNFKYIEEQKSSTNEHKKCYCEYVSKFDNLYSDFINICSQDSHNCSKLSDQPSKYNPKEFLQKLNCNEVKESEEQAAGETERNFTDTSGEGSSNLMENNPSGFNSFHIFPVVSSILGVFLVSYILYKLTPLGPFLNKSVIKRNKLEEKFNDDENSFSLENSSDIVDLKYDNMPIHIAYHQE